MPNVLDIRRRIRSVTNTRQITKAMKMVSAAKLRRAQERALAARPYAQMLTNVLKSLVSRAEIFDPETGEPKHPLLAQRPEKNVLVIVVTRRQGIGWRVQRQHHEGGIPLSSRTKPGKNIDIEAIGKKGSRPIRAPLSGARRRRRSARAPCRSSASTPNVLDKLEFEPVSEIAESVIERYSRRRDRLGLHRVQRIQVGDRAATGRGPGSAHREDRRARDRSCCKN